MGLVTDDIYRAWTFALVKEKNYSEALNVIERAVGFSPACESHLENRAKLLLLSNREDEAVDLLQRLFELNQGNETIGFLLAMKGKNFLHLKLQPHTSVSYLIIMRKALKKN